MTTLRVIQWTTGKVGKLALRAILDDPRLELVGVFAYSEDKAGVDAGNLCGRPSCGVTATTNIDDLIALGADTVIYTPFMADLDHLELLLASGLDVISTNLLFNLGGLQSQPLRERLEKACQRGGSSLFITGVNPGWVNGFAVAMTAVCRNVRSVTITETADVSVYQSAETWQAMGMGQRGTSPEMMQTVRLWMMSFEDAVYRMAESLACNLDEVEFFAEFATAAQDVDLGWFFLPEGTNAAVRAGWHGKVRGVTVITAQVNWYLTKNLAEGWQFRDEQYHLVVDGEPGIDTTVLFKAPPSWGPAEWDTMTALPAVNAAFNVRDARAGILTLRDVGLVVAPMGQWLANGNQ